VNIDYELATPREPLSPARQLKRLLPQKPINVVHGDTQTST